MSLVKILWRHIGTEAAIDRSILKTRRLLPLSMPSYRMTSEVGTLGESLGETHLVEERAEDGGAPTLESSKKAGGSKFKIYTRTGDAGQTSLYNGSRKSKTEVEFEALGDVDELNSAIGVAREFLDPTLTSLLQQLEEIQSRLIDVGTSIATPLSTSSKGKLERAKFPEGKVQLLEEQIDAMDEELPPLRNFILPSGGPGASFLHVARGVCRRAERKVVYLVGQNQVEEEVSRYMNRLSDYLFTAARYAALKAGRQETIYKKVT
ncbi:cob(I)alamin adenosyltransferase [Klebsormidium nitens]|uniref:Corrinoid adenosyltransferase MMAB n=1 Tax=Klebsormidium nitens TaxID=105231 RepID=A0A1Y1HTI3_KLENI|nr:cob(I)alamin adenosyltransferase [Klebsormidium nitens]|eukprot:GAQ81152.1 cob(I)alamin adenosyltransferase [Klebsormidium nitens]